jgi:hypothetical protein
MKILVTQEEEIRRIVVQSQPLANSSQAPISKNDSQKKKKKEKEKKEKGLVEWFKV